MTSRDARPLTISDDTKKQAIGSIRQFFASELDIEIGDLKAELVLDYMLREIGPSIYNTAIADAKSFFDERAADLAALCSRDEFTYWPASSRRRR